MAIMYQLYIYDAHENIVAKIEENPRSAIFLFIKMRNILVLQKRVFLFYFLFLVDYRKWNVGGEYVEYNYEVKDENDYLIGRIEKDYEIFQIHMIFQLI